MNKYPYTLYSWLDVEPYIFLGVLCILTFIFYKIFLTKVSEERHLSLRLQLSEINKLFFTLSAFFAIYSLCFIRLDEALIFKKITPYLASGVYILGVYLFIKICRLNVLMYLFLGSIRAGVPLLLVNIFSLVLFMIISFWSISNLWGVNLTPLLATSAAFSVVLGLALQDTLGNLFAGISLQVDKAFEIGDWLEIQNGPTKMVGQVRELTWRATILVGLSDEIITLPNKAVASSSISNYSPDGTPIMRSVFLKLPPEAPLDKAREIIEATVTQIQDVRAFPQPFTYIAEITESWVALKVLFFIDNYGRQFLIGDKVFSLCKEALAKNNIRLAHQIIEIKGSKHES